MATAAPVKSAATSGGSTGKKLTTEELVEKLKGPKNPRSIPSANFIEDVGKFMTEVGHPIDMVLPALHELHSKYKYFEKNLMYDQAHLKKKVPAIQETLDMLAFLKKKADEEEVVDTHFNLSDNVYAKATISNSDRVYLWLGADVMMEYSRDEATALLTENVEAATERLKTVNEDLVFVREQTITAQVNVARFYNWDVIQRRAAREGSS